MCVDVTFFFARVMACAATEHMGDFIAAKVAQALGMDEALEQLIVFYEHGTMARISRLELGGTKVRE